MPITPRLILLQLLKVPIIFMKLKILTLNEIESLSLSDRAATSSLDISPAQKMTQSKQLVVVCRKKSDREVSLLRLRLKILAAFLPKRSFKPSVLRPVRNRQNQDSSRISVKDSPIALDAPIIKTFMCFYSIIAAYLLPKLCSLN